MSLTAVGAFASAKQRSTRLVASAGDRPKFISAKTASWDSEGGVPRAGSGDEIVASANTSRSSTTIRSAVFLPTPLTRVSVEASPSETVA